MQDVQFLKDHVIACMRYKKKFSHIRLVCRICVCALEECNYYYNYVFFSKLKQLKEVLYDGLEKMPRKDGKTGHLIIYMLIVKPNITYLHSYNYNTHGHYFCICIHVF